jgi:hypothetical protein
MWANNRKEGFFRYGLHLSSFSNLNDTAFDSEPIKLLKYPAILGESWLLTNQDVALRQYIDLSMVNVNNNFYYAFCANDQFMSA